MKSSLASFRRAPDPCRASRASLPRLVAMLAALVAAGCTTLSEDECRRADWREIGLRDGQRGSPAARLDDHVEACGKLGIRPDARMYQAGRESGLRTYCTPRNGWERGSRAATEDASVCPADLAGGYFDGYRLGRRVYEAKQPVERLDRERRRLEERQREAKTDQERSSLREELARNDRALANARRTLRDVEDVTTRTLRTIEDTRPR